MQIWDFKEQLWLQKWTRGNCGIFTRTSGLSDWGVGGGTALQPKFKESRRTTQKEPRQLVLPRSRTTVRAARKGTAASRSFHFSNPLHGQKWAVKNNRNYKMTSCLILLPKYGKYLKELVEENVNSLQLYLVACLTLCLCRPKYTVPPAGRRSF